MGQAKEKAQSRLTREQRQGTFSEERVEKERKEEWGTERLYWDSRGNSK